MLHIFLRAVRSTLSEASPGAPRSVSNVRLGAASFLHRFGSSLNAHFHYHVLVLDGVFTANEDGVVAFHEATDLTPEHWQTLQRTVQGRVLRYFRRHGLLDGSTTADMLNWQATGGFSIDASVRIEGDDRHGIERLVRGHRREALVVLGRPSPSTGSMPWRATMRSPRPRPGSSTGCPAPPPTAGPSSVSPRSSCSSAWPGSSPRPADTSAGREGEPAESPPLHVPDLPEPSPSSGSSARSFARIRWAQLLARIYQVLPLLCPGCGGDMRLLAFLTDPPVVQGILLHLDLPHRPPPLAPARGPPQGDFLLDQTPAFDPTEPDPIPDYKFDQSIPDELAS